MSRISEVLSGKTIFVTGATGFLGQPLLEKILWATPDVRRILVLIRPKRQFGGRTLSAQERLEKELFQSNVFDRLRAQHGDQVESFLREKLHAVAGDISSENLGLDETQWRELCRSVDIVMNSAAVVSFDAPLDEALEVNVRAARRVAEFAAACDKALLVHVSTAYVCGATDRDVPETIHHSADPEKTEEPFPSRQFSDIDRELREIERIVADIRREAESPERDREFKHALIRRRGARPRKSRVIRRRERLENLRRRWLKNQLTSRGMEWARRRGWNDTYTYTKALGEQMVLRSRGEVPTVILRPSVIESSLSEPSPGWLDGLRMADPLIVAIGKGRLRALPLNEGVTLDLVPVDMVVNALLGSLPKAEQEGGLHVLQVATGSLNPITLGKLYRLIFHYFRKNPMLDRLGNPIQVRPMKFPNPAAFRLGYRLKTMPLGTAERTLERLSGFHSTHRFRRKISAARVAFERLHYYGEIYEPYLNLNCRFLVDRTMELFRSLSKEDQEAFPFDVTRLNWRHYIQNVHIPGVKKFILKLEGTGTLEPEVRDPVEMLGAGTLPRLLERSAARFGDRTALQIKRAGEFQRFSFRELQREARRVAERLHGLGLRKGDRVVLYSENQPEWGVAYLGASSLGLVVVPLDAQTWHREVWSVAEFTEAKVLLVSRACLRRLKPEALQENESREQPLRLLNVDQGGIPHDLKDYPRSTSDEPLAEPLGEPDIPEPDDPASIIFTTGTAVDPRGAVHTHRNFLSNLCGVSQYLPAKETDQILSVLPLYHALEFTCGFLMPLCFGATVTYVRSLKPKVMLETMREIGATGMLGVPTLYALIRDDLERRVLRTSKSRLKSNLAATSKQISRSVEKAFGRNIGRKLFSRVHQEVGGRVRVLVSGGSALGGELYDDFKVLGMPVYEGYGLTETAPVLTVNPLNRSRRESAGKPLPGVELTIFRPDEHGVGEIVVRTPSLMTGYYKNPAATAKVVRHGWFHTGDLGWVDEGGYLYITGRIKDVIVTGAGKNVYPMDLEAIYKTLTGIEEICILGVKSGLTEDVHAVIFPAEELRKTEEDALVRKSLQKEIQSLGSELPSYQRLQSTHVWKEPLPRTAEGGIDRAEVRRRLLAELGREQATVPSSGSFPDQERAFLYELSRISGVPVEEISIDSHLFAELGMDSLKAIELLLFIENRFGISVPDEAAERFQTVGQVLNELASRSPTSDGDTGPHVLSSSLPYEKRPALQRFLQGLSFTGLNTIYRAYFRLRPECDGSLPREGAFILAANHCSHLDTGAVISAVARLLGKDRARRLHVLGARDYFFNTPARTWFFSTFLNAIPIEREEASLAGLRLVKSILAKGEPVLIFPEGTRSRDGRLQPFKPGLGLIALEARVPIVPVYIQGTFEALPTGKTLPRPRSVQVCFGSPITMDRYRRNGEVESAHELYLKIAEDVRLAVKNLGRSTGFRSGNC